MAGLQDFRTQHPEYGDMPDNVLADKLYEKFYSDMPRGEYNAKMGVDAQLSGSAKDAAPRQLINVNRPSWLPGLPKTEGNFGRNLDDLVRSVAQGVTFNTADELAAGANTLLPATQEAKGGYSANLAAERERDKSIPTEIAVPGQILGGVMTGAGAAKAGASLMGAVKPTIPRLMAAGAVEGAGYGGAYGFGSGEGGLTNRLQNAKVGAMIGAPMGAASGLAGGLMSRNATRAKIPDLDEIKEISTQGFQVADAAGVKIAQPAFTQFADDLPKAFPKLGMKGAEKLYPATVDALEIVANVKGAEPTLTEMHMLRQILQDAKSGAKSADAMQVKTIIDKLDDFIVGLKNDPSKLVGGDATKGVDALYQGIDNWRVFRKTQVIEDLMKKAGLDAPNFSASGAENAIRTQFRALAKNNKKMAQFTPDEKEAIRQVAKGTFWGNTMRNIGRFMPTGPVSSALSPGLGYMAGGPVGAVALPFAGAVGRNLGAMATMQNAKMADALIRSGGSLPAKSGLTPEQLMLLQSLLAGGTSGVR